MTYKEFVDINKQIVATADRVLALGREIFSNPEGDWKNVKEVRQHALAKIGKEDFEEFRNENFFKWVIDGRRKDLDYLNELESGYNKLKAELAREKMKEYAKNI